MTNTAPDLLAVGDRTITVNRPFSTPLFAIDPDVGDILTYSLDSAPPGMSVEAASGELNWTPGQTGRFAVTARVTDTPGAFDIESFDIEVKDELVIGSPNHRPVLSDMGDRTVEEGLLLTVVASLQP